MLTDLIHNYEVAALEAAYLSDLCFYAELDRTEQILKAVSEKLQELINQLN